MVNVAMYDAVNGLQPLASRHAPALVPPNAATSGDPETAAATAAHDVLAAVYPDLAPRFDAALSASGAQGRTKRGDSWGRYVAAAVVDARADDGSTPNETQPGVSAPGQFPTAWPGAQFRHLEPFAIENPETYISAGPPVLTSSEYAAALNEVKQLGNAANPDDAALGTFRFWSLGSGTSQPPGAWLQVTSTVSAARSLALPATSELFALEAMALADTVAPTYETKYRFHAWRPTTAIRQADTDDNPDTVADPSWAARAGSAGSSPEHVSGHSTFSAAGATVLAGFFCNDAMPFTLTTDSSAGETRTYGGFTQAAAEAGRSRVLGGLHFEFSNAAGLASGRAVGNEVLGHALLPLRDAPPRCTA
jgi:hypothetical protein